MYRKVISMLFSTLILCACVPSAPAQTPTATIIPATATQTASPTPEPQTSTPEANHIQWEWVEANREAVNDYVFVDIIFELNKDRAYFQEFGITSKEQLKQFILDNGGYLPASQKNKNLVFFWSDYENSFEENNILMDKKIKADLNVVIVNPDEVDTTKIYGGQVHPWFLFQGQEGTAREKCVSVAIGVKRSEDHKEIVLQLIWKVGTYDLFGKKLDIPNIPTPEMVQQANDLLRGVLISGAILGQPWEWVKKHPDISLSDDIVRKSVFKFIKNNLESDLDIPKFPSQIIQ